MKRLSFSCLQIDRLYYLAAVQFTRGSLEAGYLRLLVSPDVFEKNVFGSGAEVVLFSVLNSKCAEKSQ